MQDVNKQPMGSYKFAPGYSPEAFLDALLELKGLKNDAALCRVLMIPPPVISKIRNGGLSVTNNLLVRIYDTLDIEIDESRRMMGVQS